MFGRLTAMKKAPIKLSRFLTMNTYTIFCGAFIMIKFYSFQSRVRSWLHGLCAFICGGTPVFILLSLILLSPKKRKTPRILSLIKSGLRHELALWKKCCLDGCKIKRQRLLSAKSIFQTVPSCGEYRRAAILSDLIPQALCSWMKRLFSLKRNELTRRLKRRQERLLLLQAPNQAGLE